MGVDELCEMFSALFAGKVVDVLLDGGAEQGGLGDVVEVCPGEERGVEHVYGKEEVFIFSCTTLPSGRRWDFRARRRRGRRNPSL